MSEVKSELRVGDGRILIDFVVDLGKVREQMCLQKLPLASSHRRRCVIQGRISLTRKQWLGS